MKTNTNNMAENISEKIYIEVEKLSRQIINLVNENELPINIKRLILVNVLSEVENEKIRVDQMIVNKYSSLQKQSDEEESEKKEVDENIRTECIEIPSE